MIVLAVFFLTVFGLCRFSVGRRNCSDGSLRDGLPESLEAASTSALS